MGSVTVRYRGWACALALALATGCGDAATTAPGSEALVAAELETLALDDEEFLAAFMGESFSADASTAPGGELALSVVPIVTEGELSWTRECPGGGQVRVETSFRREVDREAETVQVWAEGEKRKEGCVHVRDDVRITVDSEASFEGHRRWVERALIEATRAVMGEFTYRTSDGRRGSCEFELSAVWNPETREVTVTGTYCGREIERVIGRDPSA